MSRWLTRAAAIFANEPPQTTDKADKSPSQAGDQRLSSVVSVPGQDTCQGQDKIEAALLVSRTGHIDEMSPITLVDWYSQGWVWTEVETQTFLVWHNRFLGLGLSDTRAENLADELVARDREHDDRRLCFECRHCRPGPCCVKQLAVLDVLQRCDHFVANSS
jgi:hypothetical protein